MPLLLNIGDSFDRGLRSSVFFLFFFDNVGVGNLLESKSKIQGKGGLLKFQRRIPWIGVRETVIFVIGKYF